MNNATWLEGWDYFQSLCTEFLYYRTPNQQWHRHVKKQQPHRAYHTRHQEIAYNIQYLEIDEIPPEDHNRVNIKQLATSLVITSSLAQAININIPDTITITFGNIKITKPRVDWFVNFNTASTSTDKLWNEILAGTSYAVSDGSYFPSSQTGACAWINPPGV